jgi:hypothetical protein
MYSGEPPPGKGSGIPGTNFCSIALQSPEKEATGSQATWYGDLSMHIQNRL